MPALQRLPLLGTLVEYLPSCFMFLGPKNRERYPNHILSASADRVKLGE
jgi:hypothetical protein